MNQWDNVSVSVRVLVNIGIITFSILRYFVIYVDALN